MYSLEYWSLFVECESVSVTRIEKKKSLWDRVGFRKFTLLKWKTESQVTGASTPKPKHIREKEREGNAHIHDYVLKKAW